MSQFLRIKTTQNFSNNWNVSKNTCLPILLFAKLISLWEPRPTSYNILSFLSVLIFSSLDFWSQQGGYSNTGQKKSTKERHIRRRRQHFASHHFTFTFTFTFNPFLPFTSSPFCPFHFFPFFTLYIFWNSLPFLPFFTLLTPLTLF